MTLTKQDIDALVDGIPDIDRGKSRDMGEYWVKDTEIRRTLYLAAGPDRTDEPRGAARSPGLGGGEAEPGCPLPTEGAAEGGWRMKYRVTVLLNGREWAGGIVLDQPTALGAMVSFLADTKEWTDLERPPAIYGMVVVVTPLPTIAEGAV